MKRLIFLVLAFFAAVSTANITYSVISLTNGNQTMGVIVDNKVYPLIPNEKSSILHTGEAPTANEGYHYALLEGSNIKDTETFTRPPSSSNTKNEYYNRSWNKWDLKKLPTVLSPLPVVNRVDSDLHIDGEIPTLHIVGEQNQLDQMHANQTNKDIKVTVNVEYISPNKLETLNEATIQVSGHSTRLFAKLSYKIKIPKKQGLFGYRKLKLRAMVSTDYTYMKEFLAYDMYKSVGLPVPKFSYVRLYINNDPIGLFGLVEDLKEPWFQNEFGNGDKNYKHGTLFIGDYNAGQAVGVETNDSTILEHGGEYGLVVKGGADLSYLGNNLSNYERGYYSVKDEPSGEDKPDFTGLMDLTKFLFDASNTTTNDSVVPLWNEKMDVDSVLRGIAMEMIISNFDGYYTLTNNYVLYEDPETKRFTLSGQDFDLSMGMPALPGLIEGNYTRFPNFQVRPLSKIFNVPKFKKEFEELLVNVTTSLMGEDTLISRIDQTYKMINDDVAWDKSLPRKGKFVLEHFGGGGSSNSSQGGNQNGMVGEQLKQFQDYITKGLAFDVAVNGPVPGNGTLIIPLKEWARTRRNNLLSFLNKK